MKNLFANPLSRLRIIGIFEGVSFLLLLGVAVPLKYFASLPIAVKVSGWIHGMLFVAYLFALVDVWSTYKWKFKKVIGAFLAAILPFGTFVLEKQLRKEEEAMAATK